MNIVELYDILDFNKLNLSNEEYEFFRRVYNLKVYNLYSHYNESDQCFYQTTDKVKNSVFIHFNIINSETDDNLEHILLQKLQKLKDAVYVLDERYNLKLKPHPYIKHSTSRKTVQIMKLLDNHTMETRVMYTNTFQLKHYCNYLKSLYSPITKHTEFIPIICEELHNDNFSGKLLNVVTRYIQNILYELYDIKEPTMNKIIDVSKIDRKGKGVRTVNIPKNTAKIVFFQISLYTCVKQSLMNETYFFKKSLLSLFDEELPNIDRDNLISELLHYLKIHHKDRFVPLLMSSSEKGILNTSIILKNKDVYINYLNYICF